MSANFRDIPANFRDKKIVIFGFYKKSAANLFSTRRESLAQTNHPIFGGLPSSDLQPNWHT